ncbi:MAG TPA: DUF3015 family protein [bacterium]|jgi:hypothetical protein
MKKFIVLLAMVALMAPAAYAGKTSGCGLGAESLTGKSGMLMNLVATFLNGLSGNGTFGITSGTSGCDANDVIYNDAVREQFVAVNLNNLSAEMAQGNGQYVTVMAELMGCDTSAQPAFAQMSQSKYETLFNSADVDAKAWLTSLKQEMANDAVLSNRCTRIS